MNLPSPVSMSAVGVPGVDRTTRRVGRRGRERPKRSVASIVVGSTTGASCGVMPVPQQLEGEDAGGVSVIPGDGESPSAVERSVLDAQRRRAALSGPHGLTVVTQVAATGTGTSPSESHQVEAGDPAVLERDGDGLFPVDVDARGLVSLVHHRSLLAQRDYVQKIRNDGDR